jgi:MFS superfamily sulfate permease-like transporter
MREPGSQSSWWNTLKSDLPASLVVFLVALPLCMGIAIATGMPPATGIITGIVGGVLVGMLAGSPLQVSGPAAGLIVVAAGILQQHGPERFGLILLLAGLLQLLAGFGRLAPWFRAVSPAVLHGMLAGIGALIVLGQLHVMVDGRPSPSGWTNLLTLPEAFEKTFRAAGDELHNPLAGILGLMTIVVTFTWQKTFQKKTLIPGTLLAVIIVSVLTHSLEWKVRLVDIPPNLADAVNLLAWPGAALLDSSVWVAALVIALIASCESLLCAAAVDQLHEGPRTNFDREMAAQGIGNMVCGFLGALPMTGVIVRSSANVDAGARTRLSTILHGIWLLGLASLVPGLLGFIPIACLAGILVQTGFKLINLGVLRQLWHISRGEAIIYLVTFSVIVLGDLLTGVLVGMGLTAAKLLYIITHLKIRREVLEDSAQTVLHLEGSATFVRLPKLAAHLDDVASDTHLHIRLDRLAYIDHACLELLTNWAKQHQAKGGSLTIDWDSLQARFQTPPTRLPAKPTPRPEMQSVG